MEKRRGKLKSADATQESHRMIFDDVYRTIIQKLPFFVIPVINEIFGTDYTESEECCNGLNPPHQREEIPYRMSEYRGRADGASDVRVRCSHRVGRNKK